MEKNSVKGLFFPLSAAIVWGAAFVAQCIGAEKITPLFFNAVRFFIAVLALIPVFLIFERGATDRKKLLRTLIGGSISGLMLSIASYLQQLGITLTDSAGKAGFITGLYMIFVPIIGLFFGHRLHLRTVIGAVLGFGGLFFICMNGSALTFTFGDILLIADAVFFAIQILIIDHYGNRVYSLRFTTVQLLVTAITSLIGAAIFEEISFAPVAAAILPVLYCGIMSSGVGYTFQVLGQKYSEPTSAAILLSSESVFSAAFGALILKEKMAPIAYLGCALIFAGIIITQIKPKTAEKKEAQE